MSARSQWWQKNCHRHRPGSRENKGNSETAGCHVDRDSLRQTLAPSACSTIRRPASDVPPSVPPSAAAALRHVVLDDGRLDGALGVWSLDGAPPPRPGSSSVGQRASAPEMAPTWYALQRTC